MKCDPAGNIYMIYSDAPQAVLNQRNGVSKLPIRKLSIDHKNALLYGIPSISEYQDIIRYDFDVDARGQVYALLEAYAGREAAGGKALVDYLVVRYREDGTVDSYTKLGGIHGKTITPLRLAVFLDGSFLITGTAVVGEHGEAFSGIFDRSGQFVSGIQAPTDVNPGLLKGAGGSLTSGEPRQPSGWRGQAPEDKAPSFVTVVSGTRQISASDGNIDMLWGTDPPRVFIVSPAGEVIHQFQIPTPASGVKPLQFGPAGLDHIFVQFGPVGTALSESPDARKLITVVDPNSGEVVAAYRLAAGEDDRALAACASSPYDFLFVKASEDVKNLEVVRYSPRVY